MIKIDLIVRTSHTDILYPQYNVDVYFKLEETCRGTNYTDSLKTFQKKKDGRGGFFELKQQYARKDKCDAEIKCMITLIHTHKWKGNSSHTLDFSISQHRTPFMPMQACSLHFDYQLPNDNSRVRFMIDRIEYSDVSLHVVITMVDEDNTPGGKQHNFEAAAAHILPKDPVAKRRLLASKISAAQISLVNDD